MSQDAVAGLKSVLLLEDEVLIAMMIEGLLIDLGAKQVVTCQSIEAAVDAAQTLAIDLAVLDAQILGKESLEVATILQERGIPIVFSTGEEPVGLRNGAFATAPIVAKPFGDAAFKAGIQLAMASRVALRMDARP